MFQVALSEGQTFENAQITSQCAEFTMTEAVGSAVLSFTDGELSTTGSINTSICYFKSGVQVVGARGAAVADPAGGAVIDVQCRAQLAALLATLRAATGHGLIA